MRMKRQDTLLDLATVRQAAAAAAASQVQPSIDTLLGSDDLALAVATAATSERDPDDENVEDEDGGRA